MIDLRLTRQMHAGSQQFELDLTLRLETGKFYALYGPSGAGKTSLLRMLAGLDRPDSGHIRMGGDTWYDAASGQWLEAGKRGAAMVFQEDALFPHMNVRENLVFASNNKGNGKSVELLMRELGIEHLAGHRPESLSGGQKQRVSLARALAQQPRVLLLDEPLNALDQASREKIQTLLADIHREYQLTIFLVTHEIREVFRLAQSVLLMNHGKITTQGSPEKVFADTEKAVPSVKARVVGKHSEPAPGLSLLLHDRVIRIPVAESIYQAIELGQHLSLPLDLNHLNIRDLG